MKYSGIGTPKGSEINQIKNILNTNLPSLKNIVKRRKSFLPLGVLNSHKESNDNLNKLNKKVNSSQKNK